MGKNHKYFNGKRYKRYLTYTMKKNAEDVMWRKRRQGECARVVREKDAKTYSGIGYTVFLRKKKK